MNAPVLSFSKRSIPFPRLRNPSKKINRCPRVPAMNKPLLVFDCHEAWVYQLAALDRTMDVVVGLRGRHTTGWDENMRPVPPNARLVRMEDVLRNRREYSCVVAHNLTDLIEAKTIEAPRLLVLHETLDGALREQGSTVPADHMREAVAKFVRLTGTHVVAVSGLKGSSWGFDEDIVPFSADPAEYLPWRGDLACGLRVANHIRRRPHVLLWDFHLQAFDGLPISIVGRNTDMPGVRASSSWNDLKDTLSRHRFYIHTADPRFEDGYNMATVEAMAAGLPVLGNLHPTSPVEHGISGFLSDDPAELRAYALRLLTDRDLAVRMGQAARATVAVRFSSARFKEAFTRSIESAEQAWLRRDEPVLCGSFHN